MRERNPERAAGLGQGSLRRVPGAVGEGESDATLQRDGAVKTWTKIKWSLIREPYGVGLRAVTFVPQAQLVFSCTRWLSKTQREVALYGWRRQLQDDIHAALSRDIRAA